MKQWEQTDPLVLVEGMGATLKDDQGREYIDGNSSIWTNIHGHRHPVITAAIQEQLARVAHVSFLGTTNEPAIQLAVRLLDLLPGSGLSRVFYSDDGSTAVEVALKMSLQYWQLVGEPHRRRFVSFENAYHGDTCGAASLGGLGAFFSRFAPLQFDPVRISHPDDLECLEAPGEVAGIVIEPMVQGAAGIRLWPEGTLARLKAWCLRSGAHLIFDEVLTGFGRTGRMFACQHEGVYPDFLCLAKGLTGGYLPLAATLTTQRVYEAFLGEFAELKTFFYGHSYCGNALACAAALGSLDVFQQERTMEQLPSLINVLKECLIELGTLPGVSAVRQCGLISGIDLCQSDGSSLDWRDQTGWRVCFAARNHGLLTRNILDTVVLMPPLCITPEQIRQAARALEMAIREVIG
ncbi:MAG: adenosylmethionine--8-amino-7-oxononanoate transaminase [Terrimicrobiaceae bacterium]